MAGEPSVRGQADQSPPGARHARLLGYARHGHCRQPLCAGTRRRIPALCVHPGPRPAHSGTPVMKIEALRNPNMAFVGPIAGGGLLIAAAVLLMPSHWQIADAIRRATFAPPPVRSEEHTSELQSLMRSSYAVFCLKKKNNQTTQHIHT